MIYNQVLLLISTATILAVSESQSSETSNYHPAGLLQSLSKWQQFFDKKKWTLKNDVDYKESDLTARIENQQTGSEDVLLLSEGTAVIGTMDPVENLVVPQFLVIQTSSSSAAALPTSHYDAVDYYANHRVRKAALETVGNENARDVSTEIKYAIVPLTEIPDAYQNEIVPVTLMNVTKEPISYDFGRQGQARPVCPPDIDPGCCPACPICPACPNCPNCPGQCRTTTAFAVIGGVLLVGLAAGNIATLSALAVCAAIPPPPVPLITPPLPLITPPLPTPPQPPQPQLPNQTPINNQPMPVDGMDCPDDGCDENSVRFPDRNCSAIFSSCNDKNYWVTFDNATRLQNGCGTTGKCTPRLCDDRRVFVGRTGLCHDINDPIECPGGRRLYYSAFGDSICDCPIGQFPFPNPEDNCVPIFTRGPCPGGQVVTLSHGGRLFCTPDECQSQTSNEESLLSLVPSDRGQCQAIGSRGSCSSDDSQFLGYDVFNRRLQCTNVRNSSSPYFSFLRERRLEKKILSDQQIVKRNLKIDVPIETTHQSLTVKTNETNYRRQGTFGVFQFPSSISDSLLQPCRTGARKGFNQKCTNPLVSNSEKRQPLPPVPPRFSCPANNFLQSGGQCVNDRQTSTCGPSYQFNRFTGQCRQRF